MRPLPGMHAGGAPFISLFHDYGVILLEHLRDSLAFDVREMDQSVLAGVPPGQLEVLRGRYDPEATDRALNACSECPGPLVVTHRGVSFYSWGEDLAWDLRTKLTAPAFDQFGRGGRITIQDDYVFRTVETPGMEALIETSLGQHPSLADVEELRILAKEITDLDAYSVLFSDRTQGVEEIMQVFEQEFISAEALDQIRRGIEQGPLLRPYQALATGQGRDNNGVYMALALVHADSESAEDNVDLLRQRIMESSSLFTGQPWQEMVDSMEIRAEGRVLLARLYGRMAFAWAQFFVRLDPLLAHESGFDEPTSPAPTATRPGPTATRPAPTATRPAPTATSPAVPAPTTTTVPPPLDPNYATVDALLQNPGYDPTWGTPKYGGIARIRTASQTSNCPWCNSVNSHMAVQPQYNVLIRNDPWQGFGGGQFSPIWQRVGRSPATASPTHSI